MFIVFSSENVKPILASCCIIEPKIKAKKIDKNIPVMIVIALEKLSIRVMPAGSFHNWLKSKGKYGGQSKVPRLANHRDFIEEILSFIER